MKMTLNPENPEVAKLWTYAQGIIINIEMLHDDINRDESPEAIARRVHDRLTELGKSDLVKDFHEHLATMLGPDQISEMLRLDRPA